MQSSMFVLICAIKTIKEIAELIGACSRSSRSSGYHKWILPEQEMHTANVYHDNLQ